MPKYYVNRCFIFEFKNFLLHESAGGVLLVIMTIVAMLLANSPLVGFYDDFLATPLQTRVGDLNNAGVSLAGDTLSALLNPIPFGITAALFIGKQVEIFGACWLAIKLKLSQLPEGAT